MRRRLIAVASLVAVVAAELTACRAAHHPKPRSPRVLLIGLDGASWTILDPLLREGKLPNLDRLRQRGVTAELGTVEPLDSPPVWTTIATGRPPAVHGVTNFFATWDFIRVPTIWESLSAHGVRVGLYDYLVTWPPRPLRGGFVIPGWTRRDGRTSPPDLFARAGLPRYVYSVEELGSPHAAETIARRELTQKARYWNRLTRAFPVDVGAVTFYSFDLLAHRYWRPPAQTVLRDTAIALDRAVGTIVDAAGGDTMTIVASDHGFRARPNGVERKLKFRVPRWLASANLEEQRDGFRIIDDWGAMVVRVDARSDAIVERLRALFESARDERGAPLLHVDVVRSPAGLRPEMSASFSELVRRTPAFAYLQAYPSSDAAWTNLYPGRNVQTGHGAVRCDDLIYVEEFSGGHDPTAILFAAGGPIVHRRRRLRLHVLDLAPLILYGAGEAIPVDFEGRLPLDILDPGYVAAHPPRRTAGASPGAVQKQPVDPQLERTLRSLGYLR